METGDFIDYYEILNVTPRANVESIEHNFRQLARRYHPDNQSTGDRARFDLILQAHGILRDPEKRARYHDEHHQQLSSRWDLKSGAADAGDAPGGANGDGARMGDDFGIERDVDVQNRLLTMLYVRRRTNIKDPGIGDAELERLSSCPPEHLEFHLWYLKEKGWIKRTEEGRLTITIDGVDRATLIHQAEAARKLITDQS
jgi:curved DNA-binding protein CbpA